jgi:hypothetical protein
MSKVPIRVPTGSPVNAFLSRPVPPVPPAPLVEAPEQPDPEPPTPPAPTRPLTSGGGVREVPSPSARPTPSPTPRRLPPEPEPVVRFQFFLPVRLAKLVDAERDRRKAAGYRGRGKSDYQAIFRDLVDKHLR